MESYRKIIEKLKTMPEDKKTKREIPKVYIDRSIKVPIYIDQWVNYDKVKRLVYLLFLALAEDMEMCKDMSREEETDFFIKLSKELEQPRAGDIDL